MKKITIVIILSMLSLSMSLSQTKYGVGFEFHTMPSALLASQGATQSLGVYLPINTATLLIEPLVMYNSSTQEIEYDNFSYDDYEYSESDLTLLIGILKPTERGKIRSYFGVRFGYEWYEEDYDNNDSDVEMEYLIIAIIISSLVTLVMYLDGKVCDYNRTKGYFIKLFVFTFIITTIVYYMIRKGKQLKLMMGGNNVNHVDNVYTNIPKF